MTPRVLLVAGLCGLCGPAFAHAFLQSASPAVGSTVAAAPAEVAIVFTQGVEPLFSTIAVQDKAGADVTDGAAHAAGDPARLAVRLKRLAPGAYTVTWHVVSVDTHKTTGGFSFTVAP